MSRVPGGFFRDESGATAMEYALLAACISLAVLLAMWATVGGIRGTFEVLSNFLAAASK